MIACDCRVCTSADPRDRRSRSSALLSFGGGHLLVDTAPELRLQCLACAVRRVDALYFTHAHADHVVGLDDVRRFNDLAGGALPVFGDADTLSHLTSMFGYAFKPQVGYPSAIPQLVPHTVAGPFTLFGQEVVPLPYLHGRTQVLGLRVGKIAYCPDCSGIPDSTRALLADLDVLVLDGLRLRPHPTHFNIAQALEEAARIGARRTYLTHIAHEVLHAEVEPTLPPNVRLAYDGLVCTVA